MKLKKTLRAFVVGSLLLIGAGSLRSANAWFSATYLDTSTIVNVSSQTASPSTLVTGTGGPTATLEVWCHQFANAGETVAIQSSTSAFSLSSSTGTARINCTATNAEAEHLKLEDYAGPLYAVANATYTIPVQVIRKR